MRKKWYIFSHTKAYNLELPWYIPSDMFSCLPQWDNRCRDVFQEKERCPKSHPKRSEDLYICDSFEIDFIRFENSIDFQKRGSVMLTIEDAC